MTAGEIQELQIQHRLEEARAAIDFGADRIDEAREMASNGRAAALRTALSKLKDVYVELGRIADGEPPVPRVPENGDRPTVGVQDHGEPDPTEVEA